MVLRQWHRVSAMAIVVFVAVHIANHVVALSGVAAHTAFLEAARRVYRHPLVEPLLLACVLFQVASGLRLLVRGWRERRGFMPWLQALSGAYLVFFLLAHVSAVLLARGVLGLDTNFHFAAAGMHVPPFEFFFVPYYFLAVLAVFTHLGCAAYWQIRPERGMARRLAVAIALTAGALAALLIVLLLSGRLVPVDVPAKYKAAYPVLTR
jgi:succinate dehydrogenase/fumarate reductase cytochrome b subunit